MLRASGYRPSLQYTVSIDVVALLVAFEPVPVKSVSQVKQARPVPPAADSQSDPEEDKL
jgi:hypothetical protein